MACTFAAIFVGQLYTTGAHVVPPLIDTLLPSCFSSISQSCSVRLNIEDRRNNVINRSYLFDHLSSGPHRNRTHRFRPMASSIPFWLSGGTCYQFGNEEAPTPSDLNDAVELFDWASRFFTLALFKLWHVMRLLNSQSCYFSAVIYYFLYKPSAHEVCVKMVWRINPKMLIWFWNPPVCLLILLVICLLN